MEDVFYSSGALGRKTSIHVFFAYQITFSVCGRFPGYSKAGQTLCDLLILYVPFTYTTCFNHYVHSQKYHFVHIVQLD